MRVELRLHRECIARLNLPSFTVKLMEGNLTILGRVDN